MDEMTNYKVTYFPEDANIKDKMLVDNKPVEKISYRKGGVNYTVEYNSKEKNYWTREDGCVVKKAAYKDGVLHGKFERYEMTTAWPIGIDVYPRLAEEGHYINGKRVWRWFYYDEHEGKESVSERMFVNDKDVTDSFGKDKGKSVMDIYKLQQIERSK